MDGKNSGEPLLDVRQEGKLKRKRHMLLDPMYQASSRVAFKGQVFTAPMHWTHMLEQFKNIDKQEKLVSLPHTGAVLASMVKLQISSGLITLNKHLREATVRRNVVVQLIRMFRDAGHPDYQRLDMAEVQRRATELADSDDPSIPTLRKAMTSAWTKQRRQQKVRGQRRRSVKIWNVSDLQC